MFHSDIDTGDVTVQSSKRMKLDVLNYSRLGQSRFSGALNFVVGCSETDSRHLIVEKVKLHHHPPAGYISRLRLIVNEEWKYDLQVLLSSSEIGQLGCTDDFIQLCKRMVEGEYKFCPGIDPEIYEKEFYTKIRYHSKNVSYSKTPFNRVASIKCPLYHRLPKNASLVEKVAAEVQCAACKRLVHDLRQLVAKKATISPKRKASWTQPSSRYKMKYLSPASLKKRKQLIKQERTRDKRIVERYNRTRLTLDDEQHDEVCGIITSIENSHKDELEKVLTEADSEGVGESIREVWKIDSQKAKKHFQDDQKKNTTGKTGNRWSMVTIRVALAIFVRSPAAYEALKSFKLLQLPSRSTLQTYTSAFLDEAGACEKRLMQEANRFTKFKMRCAAEKKREPKADGVLVFDEVKVISRMMWNSRSQTMIGFAMSYEEMSSLMDVYQSIASDARTKMTTYIVQFLWRDLTSSFDIVGPYFTSSGTMESKFILSCVMETLKLFHLYSFKTSVLVCDGASTNLCTIKATMGTSGAFGMGPNVNRPHEVQPSFDNPFSPGHKIFWMICPSHQLKNQINALFSSRPGGTKSFNLGGTDFGWRAIQGMFTRECERRNSGQARMVPKLRETHVMRDSWTKLNVSPAKIMQQEQVLTELYSYIHQDNEPEDVKSVGCTLQYLEACNLLFKRGFLSHDRVFDGESEVMINIDKGYLFFQTWLDTILSKNKKFNPTDSKQRCFISWQTWDLLRIDVFGFKGLVEWFSTAYPGYFISPLRITGSAVETLLSQYKYLTGGKLDAANYATARAAYMIKKGVDVAHHSGKGYRDVTVNTGDLTLERKKYGHK